MSNELNPFKDETTYTNEQLASEIKEELGRIEIRKTYLTQMLGGLAINEDSSNLSTNL